MPGVPRRLVLLATRATLFVQVQEFLCRMPFLCKAKHRVCDGSRTHCGPSCVSKAMPAFAPFASFDDRCRSVSGAWICDGLLWDGGTRNRTLVRRPNLADERTRFAEILAGVMMW